MRPWPNLPQPSLPQSPIPCTTSPRPTSTLLSPQPSLGCHTHDPHYHLTLPEPMPENTHHYELKRYVMRERSLDWIVVERGRVEDWEETPKREKEQRFGIKNNIWDLGLCYFTLVYLGRYCSGLVNFFGCTSLGNGDFFRLWCYICQHMTFASQGVNALRTVVEGMEKKEVRLK